MNYLKSPILVMLILYFIMGLQTISSAAVKVDTINIPSDGRVCSELISENSLFCSIEGETAKLLCIDIVNHNLIWETSITDPMNYPHAPMDICISQDCTQLYCVSLEPDMLKCFDAISGSEIASYDLPDPPNFLESYQICGEVYTVVVTWHHVLVFRQDPMSLVLDIPLSGKAIIPGYNAGNSILFVPLYDMNGMAVIDFISTNGNLQAVCSNVGTISSPEICIPAFAMNCIVVVGEGYIAIHNNNDFGMLWNSTSLSNVADAFVKNGKAIILSYYSPVSGSSSWRGAILTLDISTHSVSYNYIDDTYPLQICESLNAGVAHCIDGGPYIDNGVFAPGALWTVDLNTAQIIESQPLGGENAVNWYDNATGRVYISDPTTSSILVYQL